MTIKKTLLLVFGSNLLWLAALGAAVLFARPAQASTPAAPALVGPYYATYSGADFHSYRDDFAITRDGYAVTRSTVSFGIGMAGVHLPSGAVLTQVLNDSDTANDGSGPPKVWVYACSIGGTSCSAAGSATQSTTGRHQAAGTLNNTTVDNLNNDYFAQVDLQDNSKFYYARIEYSLPSPLFLPAIMR